MLRHEASVIQAMGRHNDRENAVRSFAALRMTEWGIRVRDWKGLVPNIVGDQGSAALRRGNARVIVVSPRDSFGEISNCRQVNLTSN